MTGPPNLAEAGPWLARLTDTRFTAHRQNHGETPACTFFRARRLEARPALKVLGNKAVSKRFQICQVRLQYSGDFFPPYEGAARLPSVALSKSLPKAAAPSRG